MGVRLLRMHGYNVDSNALDHFKQQDGKFSCYGGQMIESASPIYNLSTELPSWKISRRRNT
ncbi:Gly-Xaa carboxypeptidase [Salvia divinorum]|uniref:Gly-Xaa carboxypeptidase n=1 Tax=Salvia divinorum TaxID=28513 RepID=A0ABD1FX48_SALDI